MKEYEVERRIAAQASDEHRRSISDAVIINNGSIDQLEGRVEEVWKELVAKKNSNQL